MASHSLKVANSVTLGTVEVPVLGEANIWIEESLGTRHSILFTQDLIAQTLLNTAPGQLQIVVYDESLVGIASPFVSLNNGGEKLLSVASDEAEFQLELHRLRNQIQGVNNVIQGSAPGLCEFRQAVNYPIEGFTLVVVAADVEMLDDRTRDQLVMIMKAGPRAGVSFVIHSMTLDVNPYILGLCERYQVDSRQVLDEAGEQLGTWFVPENQKLIAIAESIPRELATTGVISVRFDEIQKLGDSWSDSSAGGLTFAVGRYGASPIEITIGDKLNQRHNILVTGAVGQGKSNLISVIIHSLCERYAPEELELYLLDFKEGVTLQQFFNRETGVFLPHAKVLGLESDREFGLSTFKHLFAIYKERMAVFKKAGVQSIQDYREANPGHKMARILVVIDEFQMMFSERDPLSEQLAEYLIKSARLFRASGIHLLLASQSIGGNVNLMGSAAEGLFSQIPVRIALKNSVAESLATLGMKNDSAAYLRSREAIVNQDYGHLPANRKTSVAFADDTILAPRRRIWFERCAGRCEPPAIFEGEEKRAIPRDGVSVVNAVDSSYLSGLLGVRVNVAAEPLAAQLSPEPGRNVAIVGGGLTWAVALNYLYSTLLTGGNLSIVALNGHSSAELREKINAELRSICDQFGVELNLVARQDVGDTVTEIAASVATLSEATRPRIVLGFALDSYRNMPPEFSEIAKDGPVVGTHLVATWNKFEGFSTQVGYGGSAYFDVKAAYLLDVQSMRQLFNNPLLQAQPVDNRMTVMDAAHMLQAETVIPYLIPPSGTQKEVI